MDKELEFFIGTQNTLVEQYPGKVLVIKREQVIGVYDTVLQAYLESRRNHRMGTFLIQPCEPGPQAYTVTLSSHKVLTA